MQHIGLRREAENGAPLAHFGGNGIDLRIVQRASEESACLRFIDPYGDTVLNQLQLPVLVSELESMRDASPEQDLRANIQRTIDFVRASKGLHVYLRFTGD